MLHIHRLKLCRLVIVFDPGYCSIELAGAEMPSATCSSSAAGSLASCCWNQMCKIWLASYLAILVRPSPKNGRTSRSTAKPVTTPVADAATLVEIVFGVGSCCYRPEMRKSASLHQQCMTSRLPARSCCPEGAGCPDCPCWQCNIWGSLHQISISQCMHTLLQTGNAGTLCRLCVGLKCDGRSSASIFGGLQTKGTKCTPGMQDMFALCLLDKLE